MKITAAITAAVAAAASLNLASAQTVGLLNATRNSITFPAYSPAERKLVAEQAKLFFDVYVNTESKVTFYGKATDPHPKIKKVVETAESLTDAEFHAQMADIFLSLRDFHTNYNLPVPYSCYVSFLSFTAKEIYSETTSRKVAVDTIRTRFASLAPETAKINVGDVIVTFNGKTMDQWALELSSQGGGANNFGGFSSVVRLLTIRGHSLNFLPKEDSVTIQFQRPDNSKYTVNLPWISFRDDACFARVPSGAGAAKKATSKAPLSINLLSSVYDKIYGTTADRVKEANILPPLKNTADDTLKYTTFTNKNGNFGYVSFTSFVPSALQPGEFIALFRSLLLNELKDTKGLIIDIRGNGGGYVTIADSLPQLFAPKPVQVQKARAVVSSLNQAIFSTGLEGEDWKEAYAKVKPGDAYTPLVAFTPTELANGYGRAYFAPVAILTDSNCYSACDFWSAAMQDSDAATIWNEDLLTGAGGANVVDTDFFLSLSPALPNDPFRPLPGGQTMRVAWRQGVRNGKNAGRLIEDRGILADRRARPLLSDLLGTTNSQFDKITQDFVSKASDYQAAFYTDIDYSADIPLGSDLTLSASVRGVNKIVVKEDGAVIATNPISGASTFKKVNLFISKTRSVGAYVPLTFEGYGYDGLVFSTSRVLRLVPAPLTVASSITWDFASSKGFGIYTLTGGKQAGWNLNGRSLVIGNGQEYLPNVDTTASLFVDFAKAKSAVLKFAATVDTESNFDFFNVYAIQGTSRATVFSTSGAVGPVSRAVNLAPLLGKGPVEIQFSFISDGGVQSTGVTLSSVSFEIIA